MRGLDRLITIERFTATRDSYGEQTETWAAVDERRRASCSPLRGDERFTSDQFIARQQVAFVIRWSANVADLSPLDRIVYPPLSQESPPEEVPVEQIYDIIDIQELGRREGLRILAARRAE
jgi:head-tail adaptor